MTTLNHVCDNCESEFTLKYNEELCDDDPIYSHYLGGCTPNRKDNISGPRHKVLHYILM